MKFGKVNSLKRSGPLFPESLKRIDKPPEKLYWYGVGPADWTARPSVAIVGSRKATAYGLGVTAKLAGGLARQGITVISGLAYGVDAAAHHATIEAGGLTIAVLGSAINQIYPAQHYQLAGQICQSGGAIVSEYPPDYPAQPANFIIRNRIIAGLADVILVVEATLASGSLHTARFGLDQGKTVMAIPGNIDRFNSIGTNNLIKAGASLVNGLDDVLIALNMPFKATKQHKRHFGNALEERLLQMVSEGQNSLSQLESGAGADIAELHGAITSLEIAGYIRPQGGGYWTVA